MITALEGLRYYQREAVETVNNVISTTKEAALVVLPTGSGKSHVIGGIASTNQEKSILVLAHTQKILTQNAAKIAQYVPSHKVGVYSSGLKSRQLTKYCVAGIQSACRKPELFKAYDIIIVDEAHTIPSKGEGQYRSFLSSIGEYSLVGLTATPYRLDHGLITEDHLFDKITYEVSIGQLITEGYLTKLVSKKTKLQISTDRLKVVAGDFSKKSMSELFDRKSITEQACADLAHNHKERKKWLIFACDIQHAENITNCLQQMGIKAGCVHSKLSVDSNTIIDLYAEGYLQALVSVGTLTTGFDEPGIDLIALLRPTMSPVLHVQMIGRGSRISPGKENCLVKDYAGNLERLGPINDQAIEQKHVSLIGSKQAAEKKTKVCPKCAEINFIQAKKCVDCGFTFFVETESKLTSKASNAAVVVETKKESAKKPIKGKVVTFKVNKVTYAKHERNGKVPTLRVSYTCGIRRFNEWVAICSEGYPKVLARGWWEYRTQGSPLPSSVDTALSQISSVGLKEPKEVKIIVGSSRAEVVGYTF
jgi:DNA repair protein RadD